MRKLIVLLAAMLIAGQASAKTLDWSGTLVVDLGALNSLRMYGGGVAAVNNDWVGNHLDTLYLDGGITSSGTIPVTDPETTGQIKAIIITGTLGGKAPLPQTATLTGINATSMTIAGKNAIPLGGFTRVCILDDTCNSYLPLDNTVNSGNTGVGVGGVVTLGGAGTIRISIESGPWTLAPVTGVNQTVKGGFITLSRQGFVHGAASADSSTAANSGVIQLIAPQSVTTYGILGNSTKLSLFMTMTLHFIPEPGLLLLLGSGVVGLGLLGRSRMKRMKK